MKKILGLDLGTNSIGWAVVEYENGYHKLAECENKLTKGVIIFTEGVKIEKGNEKSRAAERTGYRSARRLKFRRKLRKYQTLLVLARNNMCALTENEAETWRKSGFKEYPEKKEFLDWLRTDEESMKNPYYFRDKFSRKKYDWENNRSVAYELGRAFYHIAQRRGFKSNRLELSDENIISDIKEQIQDNLSEEGNTTQLRQGIQEIFADYDFEKRNKGELDDTEQKLKKIWDYIYNRVLKNKIKGKDFSKLEDIKVEIDRYINRPENLGKVKKGIKELSDKIAESGSQTLGQYFWHIYQKDRNTPAYKIRTNYTAREEHYKKEFDVICDKQQLPEDLKTNLHKAIFFQRPLRSQKGLVGRCTFEKNKPRCPVSMPEFEEFRMWSFINSIKIKTPDDDQLRFLTPDEKEAIIPKFYRQKATFKFSDIVKFLKSDVDFIYYKDRESKTANYLVNYKLNTTVSGCPVSAALKSVMGDDWKTNAYTYQAVNSKGESIQRTADYKDIWHVLFTYEDNLKLKEYAEEKLRLDSSRVKKFTKISFQQGYGSLSLRAINKILPWLQKGLIYSHAVFMANLDKVVNETIWQNPDKRKLIENDIGEIIENHTDEKRKIYAVNALIKEYKKEGGSYSNEAGSEFRKDLEERLKAIYGVKTWERKEDKESLLEGTFELLKKHLQKIGSKDAFAKIKRIDDRVLEFLMDNDFVSNTKRLENLYHPSDMEVFRPEIAKNKDGSTIIVNGEGLKILPAPKTDAIKNPVLMRAMHQLRRLINQLLKEEIIDADTRVHIELARELNDANKRAAWKKRQDDLRDKREKAVEEIKKLYKAECGNDVTPTEDDVTRYLLWEEQDKREIYEDECNNISICDIIGADPKYDIEHTIPRSVSWDNSMMNKTLCSKKFNREIKKNRIPFELNNHDDILQRVKSWKGKYEKLDNEIKRINASAIVDKETKDRVIQKRHLLQFEHDYWKGKYEPFAMEEAPEGFKNSQIVDTGLITRFARKYLSCLFRTQSDNSNVFVVNGQTVSEFRKAWGLSEEYGGKSRKNHIHHCIDAVTIACMTKDKYDAFVEAWRKAEEQKEKYDVKEKLYIPKPWPCFVEDVKKLENEVLIAHTSKDNVPKQSKKKLRKRGKIQYSDKEKKRPVYLQGDTVRGSLHQDTFYGAIKLNDSSEVQYVVRKKLSDLKDNELEKIVDEKVREVVITARAKEKELKKEIENVKAKLKNSNEDEEKELKEQISNIQDRINNELYVIPPRQGKSVYTPIRKVRIKAHVKDPLPDFKEHASPFISKKDYKQQFNVVNDENYCMAIYEGKNEKGKIARVCELINYRDTAKYYRISNKKTRNEQGLPFVPKKHFKTGFLFKFVLKKNDRVVLLTGNEEIPKWDNNDWINERLYVIKGLDEDGIKLYYHQEARKTKEVLKFMNDVVNLQNFEKVIPELKQIENINSETLIQTFKNTDKKKDIFDKVNKILNEYYKGENITDRNRKIKKSKLKESSLTTPKGGEVIGKQKEFPYVKIKPNGFNALIEGIDFKLTVTGRIEPIRQQACLLAH